MSVNRNLVRQTTVTAGIGAITLLPVPGWATFADAFAVNDLAAYSLLDGFNRETGIGTVLSDGMLARTTISATLVDGAYDISAPGPITLSGGVTQVVHGPLAELMLSPSAAGTAFIEAADAGAQRTLLGLITVATTLAELKNASTTSPLAVFVMGRTTAGDGYQGCFQWRTGNFTTQAAADPLEGIYVVSNSVAVSLGFWVRVYVGAVFPQWWGWKCDSTPANAAAYDLIYPAILSFLNSQGGGAIDFRTDGDNYFPFSKAQVLYDNIEMFSSTASGSKGHIRHVNPDNDTYYRGVFGHPSTYAAADTESIEQEPKYNLGVIGLGDEVVTFTTPAQAGNFEVGDLILVASGETWLHAGLRTRRFWSECNEVTSVDAGTGVVGIKYAAQKSLGGTPVAIHINSGTTIHPQFGIPNRATRNLHIHHLHITQADTNEVDNIPLVDTPHFLFQLGGTYESNFHDLIIDSFAGWSGNQWYRCRIHDIDLRSNREVFDLGYGSHDTELYNWRWTYLPSAVTFFVGGLFYFGDGTHSNTARGFTCLGAGWNGANVLPIGGLANRWHFYDVDIDLPSHNGIYTLLLIDDESETVYHEDLNIHDVTFRGSTCARMLELNGAGGPTLPNRGHSIANLTFINIADSGTNPGSFFRIIKMPGVTVRGLRTDISATALVDTLRDGRIEGIYAPNLKLMVTGSSTGTTFGRNTWSMQQHHIRAIQPINVFVTTPNNVVFSTIIAAGTIHSGDRFRLEVWGNVLGANAAKTIQFTAGGLAVGTISWAAAETGHFRILVEANHHPSASSNRQRNYFQTDKAGVVTSGQLASNIDAATLTYMFALEAWVANAADTIEIFGYEITPITDYNVV